MSLSLRLNLIIATILAALLAAAGALILDHARQSVAQEMDSAVRLTLQLLAAASAGAIVPAVAGDDPASEPRRYQRSLVEQAQLRDALMARLARLTDVRHVDIALMPDDGMPPFSASTPSNSLPEDTPHWFARAVAPEPVEYRQQLGVPGRRIDIALQPNPADEIREAWEESRSTFMLLLAFALLVMVVASFTLHHALRPIERMVDALGRLEQGDYASARLRNVNLPELRRLATRFNLVVDTMARQQTENRALSRQALAIQEAERQHLARELHDELGQSISAIKALAVATRRRPDAAERALHNANATTEICDHVYDVVRRLMSELRPPTLDTLGLRTALEKLVDDWRDRHDTVQLELDITTDLGELSQDAAIKVYRIIQECLTNIARHADASNASIRVGCSPDGKLLLVIQDDGSGFDPATVRQGLGLLGIRERIASLDGQSSITSAPDRGTLIELSFAIVAGRQSPAMDVPARSGRREEGIA